MNKQQTQAAKLNRLERELGAKATGDPDGVAAVLNIARRLVAESPELLKKGWKEVRSKGKIAYSMDGALREALDLASPRDRTRALHASYHTLLNGVLSQAEWAQRAKMKHTDGFLILLFNDDPDTSKDDALAAYDVAIKNQGTVNVAAGKAHKRRNE